MQLTHPPAHTLLPAREQVAVPTRYKVGFLPLSEKEQQRKPAGFLSESSQAKLWRSKPHRVRSSGSEASFSLHSANRRSREITFGKGQTFRMESSNGST